MSGKSRRGRGKRSSQIRKKKGRLASPAITAQQPAATQTREPIISSKVAAPSASMPTSMSIPSAARYPFIATELRRIGILAGIVLVILVVLALVLS